MDWIFRREEKDYKKWLAGQKSDLPDETEQIKKDLKPLRDFWGNDKLDENEKFLRDYILNKGFKDHEVWHICSVLSFQIYGFNLENIKAK